MVLLWLFKVTSISVVTQFYNFPVNIFWLEIVRDYMMTLYSLYNSQVETILKIT